ncbi:MAG: SDR family oxidoreductase [Myxococcota bacterium]
MADGPVVVITGAAGGIGQALCRRWAREGARLVMLDVEQEALEAAAAALRAGGAEVLALRCDVTRYEDCRDSMDRAVQRFGRIDVMVANAGAVHRSGFADTDLSVFRRVMEVNFHGALHCAKAALPPLRESRGLIVVVSSVAGFAPLYGRSGYAASKHALHGLFESAGAELAPEGIRVMMVCPSFTRSGFEQRAMGADGVPVARPRSMVGRLASPEEVADAVVRGAARGKRLLVLSSVGRLTYYLSRLAPGLYERLMVRRLRAELAAGEP